MEIKSFHLIERKKSNYRSIGNSSSLCLCCLWYFIFLWLFQIYICYFIILNTFFHKQWILELFLIFKLFNKFEGILKYCLPIYKYLITTLIPFFTIWSILALSHCVFHGNIYFAISISLEIYLYRLVRCMLYSYVRVKNCQSLVRVDVKTYIFFYHWCSFQQDFKLRLVMCVCECR